MDTMTAEKPPTKPPAPPADATSAAPNRAWKVDAYWKLDGDGVSMTRSEADDLRAVLIEAIRNAPTRTTGGMIVLASTGATLATFDFDISHLMEKTDGHT